MTGTINASFSYAPFGEIIEDTNLGGTTEGVPAHSRRMNDKYVDDASGLAYYGARYYDPTSMTWTQTDPLYRFVPDVSKSSTPRRADLYTFTLENPLRYLDPDGRNSTKVGGLPQLSPQLCSIVNTCDALNESDFNLGGHSLGASSDWFPGDDIDLSNLCNGVTSVCQSGPSEPPDEDDETEDAAEGKPQRPEGFRVKATPDAPPGTPSISVPAEADPDPPSSELLAAVQAGIRRIGYRTSGELYSAHLDGPTGGLIAEVDATGTLNTVIVAGNRVTFVFTKP